MNNINTMNTDLGTVTGGVCESLTPITIALQPNFANGGPGKSYVIHSFFFSTMKTQSVLVSLVK